MRVCSRCPAPLTYQGHVRGKDNADIVLQGDQTGAATASALRVSLLYGQTLAIWEDLYQPLQRPLPRQYKLALRQVEETEYPGDVRKYLLRDSKHRNILIP